jgi:hypothetical protein
MTAKTTTTTTRTTTTPTGTERTSARGFLAVLVSVAVLACGCAGAAPAQSPPAAAPVHEGPLTDYVAAAGLRWLVVARLSELFHTPTLRHQLERLLPSARVEAFERANGIDLRELPSGAAAGFDYATLYLAETPDENITVETRFSDRLTAARTESPHPRIHRIQGMVGSIPQTLLHIDRRLVAVSVGDPTPARVVELFALQRLKRSPRALAGSALSTLPRDLEAAPLRCYAAGPFPEEWARGARGLLGAALAIGAGVWPEGSVLRLRIAISGRFTGEDVGAMLAAWTDLAESSLGRLLALDAPASPPEITVSDGVLTLGVKLELAPVVSGLRAAVAADVWEILGMPAPATSEPQEKVPPGTTRGP